jgi:hypothetical protein
MTPSLAVPFRKPVSEAAPSQQSSVFAIFQTFSRRQMLIDRMAGQASKLKSKDVLQW